MTEITIPFPTVQVEARLEGDDMALHWFDMPTVPMPGDVILDYGKRWVVVRREYDTEYPSKVARIIVIVRLEAEASSPS